MRTLLAGTRVTGAVILLSITVILVLMHTLPGLAIRDHGAPGILRALLDTPSWRLYGAGALAILLVGIGHAPHIWYGISTKKRRWLSGVIADTRAELLGHDADTRFEKRAELLWKEARLGLVRPSARSLLVCLVTTVLLSVGLYFALHPKQAVGDFYLAIWQAHIAFAAGALPILIFVIELANSRRGRPDRTVEVLIRESLVFPILVLLLTLSIFLSFGFVPWQIALTLLAVAFTATGYAYARTLQLLFDRPLLQSAFKSLIFEDLASNLRQNIDTRLGINLMLDRLREYGIARSYFVTSGAEDPRLLAIPCTQTGVITDVNLHALANAVRNLPWKSTIYPTEQSPDAAPADPPTEVYQLPREASIQILASYSSHVIEGRPLFLIRKEHFESIDETALHRSLSKILQVTPEPIRKRGKTLRSDLIGLREQLIDAIRTKNREAVRVSVELYGDTVDELLRELKLYGIKYDRKSAEIESGAIFGEKWEPLSWLQEDLSEVTAECFDHAPLWSMFGKVQYLPLALARTALRHGDYLTFRDLTQHLVLHQYALLHRIQDKELRSLAADRVTRWLKEFCHFPLRMAVQEVEGIDELTPINDVAEGVVLLMNRLLKEALRREDREFFDIALKRLRVLFHENLAGELPGYERRRSRSEVLPLPQRDSRLFTAAEEIDSSLRELVQLVEWGLKAWALRSFATADPDERPKIQSLYQTLVAPSSIADLTQCYLASIDHNIQSALGWDRWVTEEWEDEVPVVRSIDTTSYLDTLYVIEALNQLPHGPVINPNDLRDSRDLEYLLKPDTGRPQNVLREVERAPEKWMPLLNEGFNDAHAQALRGIWEEYLAFHLERFAERIIASPLDQTRVDSFKDSILKGYRQTHQILDLVVRIGRSELKTGETDVDLTEYGYFHTLPKEWFVSFSNVHAGFVAEDYGRSMARTMTSRMLSDMGKGLGEVDLRASEPTQVARGVKDHCETLTEQGMKPTIVIVGSWVGTQVISELADFLESETEDSEHLIGYVGEWPLYGALQWAAPMAIVADFNKLGTLVQKRIIPRSESEHAIEQRIRFSIETIDEAEAQSWIEDRPSEFLQLEDGSTRSRQEAVADLLGKVKFRLFGRVRYDVRNGIHGVKIHLPTRW